MRTINVRSTTSMVSGRFYTRDAALLTSLSPEELAANAARIASLTALDLGAVYDGIRQGLDQLAPDDRRQVLQKLTDAYLGSPSGDPLSPAVIVDNRASATDGASLAGATRALIGDINRANASRHRPVDASCAASPNTPRAINEANARYWRERNAR